MKQLLISLALIFQFTDFYSQKGYTFPENFNKYYNFNPDTSYAVLKAMFKKNSPEEIDKYAIQYFYREQFDFDANHVYLDWPEYESYLVKLLNYVIPDNATKKKLDVFIERSTVRNAGASGFGNIFFNLGMLNYAEDEAYLAEVLSHEGAHILFEHRDKKLAKRQSAMATGALDADKYASYLKIGQIFEAQADSFAIEVLKKNKLSFDNLLTDFNDEEMRNQIGRNSTSYSKLVKASDLDPKAFAKKKQKDKTPYSSHPSTIDRIEQVKKAKNACPECTKKFFLDSTLFMKFKKTAIEESKKLTFDRCDFDECIRICFRDYLYNPKNLKNLYYIIESIRRTLYIDPKLAKTGFLTQYVDDDELYYETKGILYKPDYLFQTYKQYEALKDHALFTNKVKPFNTYAEAFIYFCNQGLKYNFNEANLSLGLYYHTLNKTDSSIYFLKNYIQGNGLNTEFATTFLKANKPSIKTGKTIIIYDNIGHYNKELGGYGWFVYSYHTYNYYLAKKRKKYNPEIRKSLIKDTSNSDVVIINEYLGEKPSKLYEMQRLNYLISNLYNEDDVEMCKKIRLRSNYINEKKDISPVFKKHLLILAPEWYDWMSKKGYDKIFYVDVVYEYKFYADENESYNTYTGYYLDVNESRPYMKDAVRIGNNRKQKETEICKDLHSFLYE